MAAVLVHIDLATGPKGRHPDASSMVALAAGRTIASSWGALLCAGAIVAAPVHDLSAIESALARGGADRILFAPTRGAIVPLWDALGAAWQGILDQLRPRLVLFGADAPSTPELAPRTAARIGARLLVRASAIDEGLDEAVLRDRDGGHARAGDGGAAVAAIGRATAQRPSEARVDVVVLPPADADPRVEVVGVAPAEIGHAIGTLVALGDDVAGDPAIVAGARRLAALVGGQLVGPKAAAIPGAAIVERSTPLSPELCVLIGGAKLDIAGATRIIKIGAPVSRLVDGALPGSAAAGLAELVERLERES